LAAFVGVTSLYLLLNQENSAEADSRKSSNVDYNEVKKEIRKIMESKSQI
jgi:dihydroneopterin aldolase